MSTATSEAEPAERVASDAERLVTLFATLGLDRAAVRVSLEATLRPGTLLARAHDPDATALGGRGVASPATTEPFLPTITLGESGRGDHHGTPGADLVVTEVLGEGGMGIVHGASQRSLGRLVAVKRPLGAEGAGEGSALVEEARTMALVEHPNVVPVYALGRDAAARPVLVMKRIAGASLKELLKDRAHPSWPRLEARWGDQERACLGILAEICDALTLAHAHGIVHRDVKPENVMVGEFGEVYLLDWGIAHRVGADLTRGSIVGTPGFMAPEMVLDPDRVDARTDVYLLGATLHNVLTGTLRHSGTTFFETLSAALASEPVVYAADVPEDLAALANAATRVDPASRPASAAEFRAALAEHERHREAMGLLRGARAALAAARTAGLATAEAGALLSEAGLSIAAAARALPGSSVVTVARRDHVIALAERDLALESPQAARAHLEQLGDPEPALEARVDALERKLESARASEEALRAARAEADTRGSFRVRLALSLVVAGIFVALVVFRSSHLPGAQQPRQVLENDLTVLGLAMLSVLVWRKTLFANAGNRRLTALMLGQVVGLTVTNGVSYVLEIPHHHAIVFVNLVIAAWWGSAAAATHRAFVVPSLTALASAVVLVLVPATAGPALIVSVLAILSTSIGALLYVNRQGGS